MPSDACIVAGGGRGEPGLESQGAGREDRSSDVTTLAHFMPMKDQWDAAVLRMSRPTPFLLHGWLSAWWRTREHHADVRVYVQRQGSRVVVGLPLRIQRTPFGFSRASLLGSATAPLVDVVEAGSGDPGVAVNVIRRALQECGVIDLYPLPPESAVLRWSETERDIATIPSARSPVLDVRGDWDALYTHTYSAKRRALHRRRRRQLASGGSLEVVIGREADELASALEDAFTLHRARWAGRGDVTRFADPPSRAFHRAAIEALADDDVARILLIRVNRAAVAFVWYFVLARRMYIYRLAYDPSIGRHSPGTMAVLEALRAGIEQERVETVEFLRGLDTYKLEWATRVDVLSRAALGRSRAHGVAAEMVLQSVRVRRRVNGFRTSARRSFAAVRCRARERQGKGASDSLR